MIYSAYALSLVKACVMCYWYHSGLLSHSNLLQQVLSALCEC